MAIPDHERVTPESTLNHDTKGYYPPTSVATTITVNESFLDRRSKGYMCFTGFDEFSAEKLSLCYHTRANTTVIGSFTLSV